MGGNHSLLLAAACLFASGGCAGENRVSGGESSAPGAAATATAAATQRSTTADAGEVEDPVAQATRLISGQRFEEAATLLEASVAADPENGQAWLLLAVARHGGGRLDEALAACQRAEATPATRGAAIRERFLVRISQGDLEGALEEYRSLREFPMIDFSGLHLAPQLAKLRGDARFVDLFPTDFSDPFAEGRAVIHDWSGEGAGHEFGWEARAIGDVDGDGVVDAVVSAPATQPGGGAAGKVYIYSGRSGKLVWSAAGADNEHLGSGVEAAGDVDADGVPDVIAGAAGGGRAYVYAGRTGAVLLTLRAAADDGASYGDKVSGAGDLDGDGHGDVVVGASTARGGAGRVYVYSGAGGAILRQIEGEEADDALGSAAAAASGAWGALLVVGAPNAGPAGTGRVYVYDSLASAQPRFVIDAEPTGRQLGGMFVSVIGDLDADGMPDVYASDWMDAAHGPVTGRIYVHSGRDGEQLLTLMGEGPGEGFGIGPARAGDVNGDGHADLVIGAWQHGSAAHSGGKVYVFSGKDGSTLATYTGRIPGETLGFDADGMGDVDGDGRADFLVTSAWSLINGVRSGRAMIVSGLLR